MTNKYGSKSVVIDDHRFPSKGEAARYCVLKAMETKGEIKDLVLQPRFKFACGITYTADFQYECKGSKDPIVEDFKGKVTYPFKMKQKMMAHEFGITVKVTQMRSSEVNAILKKEGAI